MGVITTLRGTLDWAMSQVGYIRTPSAHEQVLRMNGYHLNQMMYDNTVYLPQAWGGLLEPILKAYCGVPTGKGRIIGHFNPAKEIVEFYVGAVMNGTWGKEIRPVALDGHTAMPDPLLQSLTTVWRDSNWDSQKSPMIRLAANYGTVGIRVTRLPGTNRVTMQWDEPWKIFNVEEDAAGNAVDVVLKWDLPVNTGSALEPSWESVEVIEHINKDEFSRTYNGKEQVPPDDRKNPYGFCPYVLNRHKDNGTMFGDHAYKGAEPQIHDINWRITCQGLSIHRHQFPKWAFAAGGAKPTEMDLGGDQKAIYMQLQQGTPTPFAEAIVPKIDQAAASGYNMELRDMLRGRQPELNFNDVKILSGISGETIAAVLKPCELAVDAVRPNNDHAVTRAMQMAVSERIVLGIDTDLGQNADQIFNDGGTAFVFADRPSLPLTTYQQVAQVQADHADTTARLANAKSMQNLGVDAETYLKAAGFSDADAKRIAGHIKTMGVTDNNQP